MTKEEFESIKKSAHEKYDGDVELAIAAGIYGDSVIARCGKAIPSFTDRKQLSALKGRFTKFLNAEKKLKNKSEKEK